MKRALAIAVALLAAAAAPAPAHATFVELHAALRLGASTGKGIGGAQQDHDFFEGTKGGAWGALVGLRVLVLDVYVQHDQLTDFSSVKGTWTQFMIGPGFSFALDGKLHADMGVGVGVGLGTGQQIDPPLDNGEISDKGIMLELHLGVEYKIAPFVGLGVTLPIEWGYMFKNGVPANDVSNHYQTMRAMLLGTVTFRIGL